MFFVPTRIWIDTKYRRTILKRSCIFTMHVNNNDSRGRISRPVC